MATEFLLLTILILLSPLSASSKPPATYIIHMNSSAMPKIFSNHHHWYSTTLSSLLTATTATTSHHIYTYNNVINGFSATLSSSELALLQKAPGFISFTRDMPITTHTTHTPQFLGLNAVSGAWPVSNYGKDVIIGVIDSGIWPESKSFDDDGMGEVPARWKGECVKCNNEMNASTFCNKKIVGARFYNKGLLSNKPEVNIGVNSSTDTDGHGTHTSSTAAGNYVENASFYGYAPGTARGMAPRAHLAIYKVVWNGDGYSSDVLAAIDQAIADGVDVLSLSIGLDGYPLYEDPVALGSFAAMEKGILVISSAGNAGPWFGTLHNGIPWLVNVAAGTVDRDFNGVVALGNGISIPGTSLYHGNNFSVPDLPLVLANGCDKIENLKKIENKILVCEDKDGSVGSMVKNAASAASIAGGIFISDSKNIEFYAETEFPSAFLSLEDGKTVLDYVKNSSEPRARLEFGKTRLGVKPAPLVASYSSRGPSASCPSILKPDIMAPGTLILASWPQNVQLSDHSSKGSFGNFNMISGTSMACPHVAGIAALVKGAHPEWSPAAIRSAIMTTANPLDNSLVPIKDNGDSKNVVSPLAMGAGHISPNKALNPGLVYDASGNDYISLLCGMNFTSRQIQMITRSATLNCSSDPSLDLNYPSFIAYFKDNETEKSSSSVEVVKEFRRTLTNVGSDGRSVYEAKVTEMSGFEAEVEPEKLVFGKKYERKSYWLRLKGAKMMKEIVVHGSISWVDVEGKYVVRSPIVATRLNINLLNQEN